jgi:predicted Zn-dependent protease
MIVGHEMAHNTRRHRAAKERNAALGTLAGGLLGALVNQATGLDGSDFVDTGAETGALAYSQQFETEADYVGMYLVARAGYKIDNVEDMWRRMALQSVSKLDFTNTHPPDAQRYLGLAATREEIRAKQASGQPLLPNMKKKSQ